MSITAALVTFGVIVLAELPDKTMVASLVLGSRFRPIHVWVGVAAAFLIHVTVAVAAGSAFSHLPGRVVDAITMVLFMLGAVLVLREGTEDGERADGEEADRKSGGANRTEPNPGDRPGGVGESPGTSTDPDAPAGALTCDETEASGAGVPRSAAAMTGASGPAAPGTATFWPVAVTSFGVVFLAELGDLTQITTANLAARFDSPVSVWLGAVLGLWTVAALAIAGGRGLLRLMPISVITRIAAVAFLVLAVISGIEVVRG
ncbi:Ca2+/H+ antiporter, TMEM165/GDT1 family [Frankia sp. AiPs1]|uniref:TMEM165/GDT1 family protein n=1 Tax=Frankia sp. AiPa1 TaxID=573492 RepID=UPI00202B0E0F|nr:TMEM165/GDT1 family protein [Frankia sp. AiPa1]MCL9759928.1 TMEM165/GDT1 family protein [Frankia sp. AiPa1]